MRENDSSSRRILKSTAIIGGSNVLMAVMRIAQMKVFAVLLGPIGMGLLGLYYSVMSTAATVGGLGIASSGVRQISDANASGNDRAGVVALVTLRRLTLLLAATAALGLFLLRRLVSAWIFGNEEQAGAVGLLSFGVLCTIISGSQVAVLNGLRRIKDIARVNVVGAALGTFVSVPLVFLWGKQALVYAILSTTLIALLCSWWFVRRIPRPASKPSHAEVKVESFSLLRLGAAFLVAGLMMTVALLLTRIIILNHLGMASVGYFQAAWSIVVFYIDFILNAMGVDYYPHLTSRIHDQKAAHHLVNEQTEVVLLLGGPLILGMLMFAPALIFIFYSAEFGATTNLLRWLLLGNILKLVSWPLGYLIMAHAWAKMFVFAEIVWVSIYLSLVYFGAPYFGINAVGYAFAASYLIYAAVVFVIANRLSGFVWTPINLLLGAGVSLAAVLVMTLVLRAGLVGYLISGLVTLGFLIYSLRRLYRMVENRTAIRIVNAIQKFISARLA